MKRIATFFSALFLVTFLSHGQDTVRCNLTVVDTVKYTNSKTQTYTTISMNHSNDGGSFGYAGYGQRFEAPDSIFLLGFSFNGFVFSGNADTVVCRLFEANALGLPGVQIDSVIYNMPLVAGYGGSMNSNAIRNTVNFSSGHYIEGDYIITIQNLSGSDMFLVRNADGNGAAEDLSYTYYRGVTDPQYDGWYKCFPFGNGWNFDMIFQPIVSYEVEGTVITNDTAFCMNDTIRLDVSLEGGSPVLANKFYNPNFSVYSGIFSLNNFDYGDGGVPTSDTFYVYNTGGILNVSADYNVFFPSWTTSNINLTCGFDVNVTDPTVFIGADTSICAGEFLTFDLGAGYDTYLWSNLSSSSVYEVDSDTLNNGVYQVYVDVTLSNCPSSDTILFTVGDLVVNLGNDTTLCLNQDLLLTAGTYDYYLWNTGQLSESIQVGPFVSSDVQTYILTATSGDCEGSDTLVVTIDNCLSVAQIENSFSIFPNPSNGVFNISFDSSITSPSEIMVLDVSGRQIYSSFIDSNNLNVDVSKYENGVYFVVIKGGNYQVTKKIEIIN